MSNGAEINRTTPGERETKLVERFEVIEDLQERLQALCSYKPRVVELREELCNDGNLVRGCSSPVWIDGSVCDGRLELSMRSPTTLVRSLAGIVCDLCNQSTPSEIFVWEPSWLQKLRVDRYVSGTRQNGLAAIFQRIRFLAEQQANAS